jgi:hypothetical protein
VWAIKKSVLQMSKVMDKQNFVKNRMKLLRVQEIMGGKIARGKKAWNAPHAKRFAGLALTPHLP